VENDEENFGGCDQMDRSHSNGSSVPYKSRQEFVGRQTSEFTLSMPKGARILTARSVEGLPVLSAVAEADTQLELRHFCLVREGQVMADRYRTRYVAPIDMGYAFWHLFEKVNEHE
jgi:hypothetical protein